MNASYICATFSPAHIIHTNKRHKCELLRMEGKRNCIVILPQFTSLNGPTAAAVAIDADTLTMNQPTREAETWARMRESETSRNFAYCMFRLYFKQPLISAVCTVCCFTVVCVQKVDFQVFSMTENKNGLCHTCRIIIFSYFVPHKTTHTHIICKASLYSHMK